MAYSIEGLFDSITNFNAGGDISLDIVGKVNLSKLQVLPDTTVNLGKVELDVGVSGGTDMGYDGKEAYVKFYGSFELQNITRRFRKDLDASNADMTQAGRLVYGEISDILFMSGR